MDIKRFTDACVSFVVIFSPLLIITALFIVFTMLWPVFFRQNRIVYKGWRYSIYKFRSMKMDDEAESTFAFDKDQERLTGFDKLIRRLKIDELPQLFDVLKGNMGLVGPRPTIEQQTKALLEKAVANILGVVMNNKALIKGRGKYYYYYYGNSSGDE